jgi:hypothetical protein
MEAANGPQGLEDILYLWEPHIVFGDIMLNWGSEFRQLRAVRLLAAGASVIRHTHNIHASQMRQHGIKP